MMAAIVSAFTVRVVYPSFVQTMGVLSNDRLIRKIIREKTEAAVNVL